MKRIMTTQLFLNSLIFTAQLFKDKTNLHSVLFIYIVLLFLNVQCNNLKLFKNFQGRKKILKYSKMFFRNQGHNSF